MRQLHCARRCRLALIDTTILLTGLTVEREVLVAEHDHHTPTASAEHGAPPAPNLPAETLHHFYGEASADDYAPTTSFFVFTIAASGQLYETGL